MHAFTLGEILARLHGAANLTAGDALAVRRAVFGDAVVMLEEVEALIALDEAAKTRAPEWTELFVEAISVILVHQQQPAGYIDEAQAQWLIDHLFRDGRIKTDSELEVLVRILEIAESAPASLTAFALAQVKAAVITGEAPLDRGEHHMPGRVTASEVALTRRILYAAAGDANLAITRAEAEALFDINDACRGGRNDPAWADLFAKAIAASVMTVSGYAPLDREAAGRRDAWLAGDGEGVGSFIGKMFHAAPSLTPREALAAIVNPSDGLDDWRAKARADEAVAHAAEAVAADEAKWLVSRIGRDGVFDDAERAVIDFLRKESPSIDPALRPLLEA